MSVGTSAYRAAHVGQRLLGPLHPCALGADGESPHYVTAELHRDATALETIHFTFNLKLGLLMAKKQ